MNLQRCAKYYENIANTGLRGGRLTAKEAIRLTEKLGYKRIK